MEVADLVDLEDVLRAGACHDATPTATGILLDRHAFGFGELLRLVFGHEGADGLFQVLERGVVIVHHHVGHDIDHRTHDVELVQLIHESAGELGADISLAHGVAVLQRHEGHVGGIIVMGHLEGLVDDANLRSVAVGDDNVDALLDHLGNEFGAIGNMGALLLGVVSQGVSAQGDDDALTHQIGLVHDAPLSEVN